MVGVGVACEERRLDGYLFHHGHRGQRSLERLDAREARRDLGE
jgi:hypothetical protein